MKFSKIIIVMFVFELLHSNSSFIYAQKNSTNWKSVGIEIGNFFSNYSVFYQCNKSKLMYKVQIGYALDSYNKNHGSGSYSKVEIGIRLTQTSNYLFYTSGIFHSYMFNNKALIDDGMYTLKYKYNLHAVGKTEFLGYQWNYFKWNFAILGGLQYFYLLENIYNQEYKWISSAITPQNTEDYTISKFKILPAFNISFGYLF